MALPIVIHASQRPLPVSIKARGVRLDAALKRSILASARSALGRFSRRLRGVFVWIEDTNGPRDGSGIRCRIELALLPGGRLTVSAEAANEFAAVARCTDRAWELMDRHVKKRRHVRRRARVLRHKI
ncbi:MAG TPA: hypothetical protein VF175_05915 [Lacipirellula sp.]